MLQRSADAELTDEGFDYHLQIEGDIKLLP